MKIDQKQLVKLSGGVIAVAAAVCVVVIVVYYLARKTKNVTSNIKLVQEANAEIDTKSVTVTPVQISSVVSKLKAAFYSGLWGCSEDEDAIYAAYDMLSSRSDVLMVEKEFGVYKDMTLREHVHKLLSVSEIAHLNSILSAKGIDYQY